MQLVHPFTIARGTSGDARSVMLELTHDGLTGRGEAAPVSRYGESIASVRSALDGIATSEMHPLRADAVLAALPPAARCALDVAIHDWLTLALGVPLWQYLELDPARTPVTSWTIGIDTVEKMLAKLEPLREYPIIKLKLGTAYDLEIVEAVRSRYTGTLRVDANEGWTAEEAVRILGELERFDIEFCEQPIPAGTPERLRWIRERTRIPLVADEDVHDAADVLALRGCVDGVNLKLVKSGGITGGLALIRAARALKLKVMIGCMIESSILTSAAAHLTPLADWADLDGPLLVKDDPYAGVTYAGGKLVLPAASGLGVTPRAVPARAPD